jgi:hypothetical protein
VGIVLFWFFRGGILLLATLYVFKYIAMSVVYATQRTSRVGLVILVVSVAAGVGVCLCVYCLISRWKLMALLPTNPLKKGHCCLPRSQLRSF